MYAATRLYSRCHIDTHKITKKDTQGPPSSYRQDRDLKMILVDRFNRGDSQRNFI